MLPVPLPPKPCGYQGRWGTGQSILPLPSKEAHCLPPWLPTLTPSQPHSLHLSHVLQEDAPSAQQGMGRAATEEDPVVGQVSQDLPHQLTQVEAANHLLKPAGGRVAGEAFLSLLPQGPTCESPQGGTIFFSVPRLEVPGANGFPGDSWVFTQTPLPPPVGVRVRGLLEGDRTQRGG